MTSTLKLFVVLVTLSVAVLGWIMGQYRDRDYMILLLICISATLLTFLILNIYEHKQQVRRRKKRESKSHTKVNTATEKIKRSKGSFALTEKKSGLTWGGGNIKASVGTRGNKRKFLGH